MLGCLTFAQTTEYETVLPEAGYDLPSRRIVMTPVTVPDDVIIPEDRVRRVDSLLLAALRGAGYDVVPAAEYAAIWDSLTAAAGGFFDPYTGVRRDSVYRAATTALFGVLKTRFEPEVLMYPELWVSEAYVYGGYAYWDGFREAFDLRYREGPVLALSLLLSAEDLTPREVFNHGTGVHVLERIGPDHATLQMIERDDILADSVVVREAVERLVRPLARLASVTDSPRAAPVR